MRRRAFLALLGATAGWPLGLRGEPQDRIRRIGILLNLALDDPESEAFVAAFSRGLNDLGWSDGRNVRIDYRAGAGDAERYRKYAAELVALSPDVILAGNSTIVRVVQQLTRTIPIVFAGGTDPVGGGLVASLARPGGNVTGFSSFEFEMAGKWLELLKQAAPGVTRAAVLRDPTAVAGTGQLQTIEVAAPAFGVELIAIDSRDAGELDRAIAAFARESNGGLIAVSSASVARHRDRIIALALQHRLPAIYPFRYFAVSGGLMSYGPERLEPYRLAAGYVDRILKGGSRPSCRSKRRPNTNW
jgi:putative ABC transport system substrate-binding protein